LVGFSLISYPRSFFEVLRKTPGEMCNVFILFNRRNAAMELLTMRQRSRRITWFLTVQLIALVGWILVQSFFSISALGRTIPFAVTIVIEAIWWIATLVIMFLLFRREYNGFVKAVLELEEANKSLRRATNDFLLERRNPSEQEL
jgi:hypothetical protein